MGIPAVSVIMPVYNAAPYVGEAIRSVLGQTFTDLELIIVNDGSTDGSAAVIRSFSDPRIVHEAQANGGIVSALNKALSLARAPLIARQDADDVSLPNRLARQVDFLSAHPEIGLLGTWARTINTDGSTTGVLEHALDHAAIRYSLLFDSPFVHPSVVFRRDLLDRIGTYRKDPLVFEDLDLWMRMLPATRSANLPFHGILYRNVATSIMNRTRDMASRLIEHRRRMLSRELPGLADRLVQLMLQLGISYPSATAEDLLALRSILFGYIDRITDDAATKRALRADLLIRLMSARMIPHHSWLHRAADKLRKQLVLGSPERNADRS